MVDKAMETNECASCELGLVKQADAFAVRKQADLEVALHGLMSRRSTVIRLHSTSE